MSNLILIVDDDQAMCEMLEVHLKQRGLASSWATSANAALELLKAQDVDVVLADINMPGMNGITLCQRITAEGNEIPVIMMTAFGSLDTAISAIRAGAYDFVTKPVELDMLSIVIDRALAHRNLKQQISILHKVIDAGKSFDNLLGESPLMKNLFAQMERISPTESSVLVIGESGTGKELVARALHNRSKRSNGPFISVNCSALSETLLESELFGHQHGAFTDAETDRQGKFHEANGGTLFLDEIGEIPLALQPRLLRALEERVLRPMGGIQEIPFDVRIISATNRDLEYAVEQGNFREDLFYRLNVIQMDLPPLRSRGTDILLLAQHFIALYAGVNSKNVNGMLDGVAEKLLAYDWPGNVRELRNAIERSVALTHYDKIVIDDLPAKINRFQSDKLVLELYDPAELIPMEEVERRYIYQVLKSVKGNRTTASRILKMDRKTLYRKLQRYGWDENTVSEFKSTVVQDRSSLG